LFIGAGAAIAIVMLVLGALTYMFSDIAKNKTGALSRIRNAMWAIVLLLSSYLILNTINPDLVKFKLNLSATGTTQAPTTPAAQQTLTLDQQQAAASQCMAQNPGKYCTVGVSGGCSCTIVSNGTL
jgi:hypothetical protein